MKKFSLSVALLTAFLMSSGVAHAQNCDEIASSYLCGNRIPNIVVTAPRPFWTHGANLHGILGALDDAQLRAFTAAATYAVLSQLQNAGRHGITAENVGDRQVDAELLAEARAVPEIIVRSTLVWRTRSRMANSRNAPFATSPSIPDAALREFVNASIAAVRLAFELHGLPVPSDALIADRQARAARLIEAREDWRAIRQEIAEFAIENCSEIAALVEAGGYTAALTGTITATAPLWISMPPMVIVGAGVGLAGHAVGVIVCTDD